MLQFSESDKGKSEAEYTDVQGETLRITECNITAMNRINTESAEVSYVKAHGDYPKNCVNLQAGVE